MLPEPLQPTPYASVNEALAYLLEQARTILGGQFAGMYLSGSLASGGFDLGTSDIDFVVVTAEVLPDDLFRALQEMHADFDKSGSPWAGRIEGVYVPPGAFRRGSPAGTRYPQIEKGRALFLDQLESGWIYHCYILREHGVTLAGPKPRTFIDPVDPDDMRRAAAPIAELWLQQASDDPSWLDWLRNRDAPAFVVLTLCRLLYTLETGSVASKPAAARWAQGTLDPGWSGLIERSLAGQHDKAATPESDVSSTVDLVRYAVHRFHRWQNPSVS